MNIDASFNRLHKLGFIGSGHITQAICKGLVTSQTILASSLYVTNRTPQKAIKLSEELGIHSCHTNEEILDVCSLIFLAVKPHDYNDLLDDISQYILPHHHIISLAAGIGTDQLKRHLNHEKISRVIPNTAVSILRGVTGIYSTHEDQSHILNNLFKPLGQSLIVENEEMLDSLLIATSSGLGFTLELMSYFCEWLESHGFTKAEARKLIEATFIGAGLTASLSPTKSLDVLISQVASKKGVTASGLDSMRRLELDRIIRLSLDSAQNRNEELARLLS